MYATFLPSPLFFISTYGQVLVMLLTLDRQIAAD